jgi:hypothetical protein
VISRQKLEVCLLAVGVAVSRFAFRSHDLYDLDSVNFALGLARFDPRVHQPHPPGYFLYVCLGRVVNLLVHDANLAFVVVSVLASIASVILIYALARAWFGNLAATFAGLLFLFSPLEWFHGTVALTYSVEGAASALLGLLCWRIDRGRIGAVVPAAIALGISAGIRPSSLMFLGPLFLYALRSVPWKWRLIGIVALALTGIAWFLPMLGAAGGADAYFGALRSLWLMVPSKGTIFNSSPTNSVARAITIVFIYFLAFGAAVIAPFGASLTATPAEKGKTLFTAVWVAPALCFFTFIFLKLVNSGYLLLVAAPGCIWLGKWMAEWFCAAAWPRPLRLACLGLGGAANLAIYLAFPAYCSYGSVQRFEQELQATETSLPQIGSPGSLLIVSFDNHQMGYRHAGYYFPGYLTLEYPEANLLEGKRIFAMRDRDSFLLSILPADMPARFVFFPLPAGRPEYVQYLEEVEKKLPAQDLKTVDLGGHRFVTAPTSDLGFLFPDAVPSASKNVAARLYTAHSTALLQP